MSTATVRNPTARRRERVRPESDHAPSRSGIGRVVVGSMTIGLVVAGALVSAPFVPARAHVLTGLALLGLAVGWALVAALSVQFTARPQRWAVAPAVFLMVAALTAILGPDTDLGHGFRWAWPPMLIVLVVWSIGRARRRTPGRARRWLVYPLLIGLALSAIGGGYETVREAIDAAANPMPGQLIDVGGHRLHLSCTGSGTPTVVLEPGLGEVSSAMAWVAGDVAQSSRVCVYDRAGKGWSDPVDGPQDAVRTATDLHTLLHRAEIPGPYVLAGHSFGGLYVLTFAAQFPDQVAGVVLLDSTAPAQGPAAPATNGSYDIVGRISALVAATANLGAARTFADSYDSLPPRSRSEARARVYTASSVQSYIDEFRAGADSARQAATLVDLDDKPLIVLTAGRQPKAWHADQDRLATLSSNSRHHVVPGATHASLYLDRTHAAAAGQAIRDVVASVRAMRPLK